MTDKGVHGDLNGVHTKVIFGVLSPVYTIRPVVKPVVKPVWQPVVSCVQTFNRLSNPFDNRFDNRLYRVYSRLSYLLYKRSVAVRSTRLNEQWLFVQHGCQTMFVEPVVQPGLTTGWTNSCSFNTIVKPVVKPVWQPAVWCIYVKNLPV